MTYREATRPQDCSNFKPFTVESRGLRMRVVCAHGDGNSIFVLRQVYVYTKPAWLRWVPFWKGWRETAWSEEEEEFFRDTQTGEVLNAEGHPVNTRLYHILHEAFGVLKGRRRVREIRTQRKG